MSGFHYSSAALFSFTATTNDMLRDGIRNFLVAMGWQQTGTVSGGYVLKSVATAQGLQCEVTIASNVAVEVFFGPVGGGGPVATHYLIPAPVPYAYSIHAGIYQFFVFIPGVTAARTYCGGGTPFMPAPANNHTHLIWSQGNGNSAADTTVRRSFRTVSDAQDDSNAYQNTDNVPGAVGTAHRWVNTAAVGNGNQRLFVPTAHRDGTQFTGAHENSGFCWGEGDLGTGTNPTRNGVGVKVPPIIGWGLRGVGDFPRAKGELWDTMLETQAYPEGSRSAFDGREWMCLTHMNISCHSRGSIWMAVG